MIGLSEELPGPEEGYELHRLLGALLSQKLTVEEKLTIMETEYHIPVEDNLRKDVNVMCNLGEGIEEKAIAIGEARGEGDEGLEAVACVIINRFNAKKWFTGYYVLNGKKIPSCDIFSWY